MRDALGWRAKVGVIVPSTNTIVQPDCEALRLDGVTCHVARIAVPNMKIASDDDFSKLVAMSQEALDQAVDRLMTCEPDVLAVGMSSIMVWDGREASEKRRDALARRIGIPVTGGSFGMAAALEKLGCRRVAALSPYQPVADRETQRFLEGYGIEVKRFVGLRCPSPTAIAAVPADEVERQLAALDGPDVDAIVQIGTNLSTLRVAPKLEARLGKPVLAINAVAMWHALRLLGIEDHIQGYGRLLAEF